MSLNEMVTFLGIGDHVFNCLVRIDAIICKMCSSILCCWDVDVKMNLEMIRECEKRKLGLFDPGWRPFSSKHSSDMRLHQECCWWSSSGALTSKRSKSTCSETSLSVLKWLFPHAEKFHLKTCSHARREAFKAAVHCYMHTTWVYTFTMSELSRIHFSLCFHGIPEPSILQPA